MSRRDRKKKEGAGWIVTRGCPRCGRREDECVCVGGSSSSDESAAAEASVLRLRREKRRGKPVTVVAATGVPASELRDLGRDLKAKLATGGSTKGEEVELQGDHLDRVRELLVERGYRVRG